MLPLTSRTCRSPMPLANVLICSDEDVAAILSILQILRIIPRQLKSLFKCPAFAAAPWHPLRSRGESARTTSPPHHSSADPQAAAQRQWLAVLALIAALTVMRIVYASVLDLRTDEAYYWTWSKEGALSFLDHPPMIAWFIRFGTTIF